MHLRQHRPTSYGCESGSDLVAAEPIAFFLSGNSYLVGFTQTPGRSSHWECVQTAHPNAATVAVNGLLEYSFNNHCI